MGVQRVQAADPETVACGQNTPCPSLIGWFWRKLVKNHGKTEADPYRRTE